MTVPDLLLVHDGAQRWSEGVRAVYFAGNPPLLSQ